MSGVFKAIGKVFKKIINSPIFKIVLIAAAIYFTAGMAMAAMPAIGAASATASLGAGISSAAALGVEVGVGAGTLATAAGVSTTASAALATVGIAATEIAPTVALFAEGAAPLVGEAALNISTAAITSGEAAITGGIVESGLAPALTESATALTGVPEVAFQEVAAGVPEFANVGAVPEVVTQGQMGIVESLGSEAAMGGSEAITQGAAGITESLGSEIATNTPSLLDKGFSAVKELGSDAYKWYTDLGKTNPVLQKVLTEGGMQAIKGGFDAYSKGEAAKELAATKKRQTYRPDNSGMYKKPYKTPGIINSGI